MQAFNETEDIEHRTPITPYIYEQLLAATVKRKMLPTTMSEVWIAYSSPSRIQWCFMLQQTSMDRCTQLVYLTRSNVQPVQLVVRRCRRWLNPRSYFCVSLTTRAAAFITRWSLSVVDLDAPAKMALQ